jgi:ABC-2 type transport system permease protein
MVSYYYYAVAFGAESPFLKPYGGNLVAYLVVGLSLNSLLAYSLSGPFKTVQSLYSGKIGSFGTFVSLADYYEMANIPINLYLMTEMSYGYLQSLIFTTFYLIFGAIFFGFNIQGPIDYLGLMVCLIVGILATLGIGFISASMIWVLDIWYGQEPIQWLVGIIVNIASGIYFPPEVLPPFLKFFSDILPQTYTLRIARLVTLSRTPLVELAPDITILATEAVVLVSMGYFLLKHSFRVAKIKGSLIR